MYLYFIHLFVIPPQFIHAQVLEHTDEGKIDFNIHDFLLHDTERRGPLENE